MRKSGKWPSLKTSRKQRLWLGMGYISLLLFGFQLGLQAQETLSIDTLADLPVVVLTAQFSPTETRSTVNSVRVIDKQVIQQRASSSLQELLATEANLRIQVDPVLGSVAVINGMRAENLSILVDGVPIIGRLDGNIDLGQLALDGVQQVEIVEGAQSIIYGSAAAAGVINLISEGRGLHRVKASASSLQETNGFHNFHAAATLQAGKWGGNIQGGKQIFRPQTDDNARSQLWNPKDQHSLKASVFYDPNSRFSWRLNTQFFNEVVSNLGEIRRPTFRPYAFDDTYLTTRKDINLSGKGWLGKRYYLQHTLAYNLFDRIKNTHRYNLEEEERILVPNEQDTSRAEAWLIRSLLASEPSHKAWSWLAGIEFYREAATGARIIDEAQANREQAFNTAYAIMGSIKYSPSKRLKLQLGSRYNYNTRFGSAFTPALWAAWETENKESLRFSYANGFRSPSIKELFFQFIDINHFILGNQALLPERSHNLSIEAQKTDISLASLRMGASLRAFYNQVQDRIVLAEFAPLQFTYTNTAEWRSTGLGISLDFRYKKQLTFTSSFVHTGFYNRLAAENLGSTFVWSPEWANNFDYHFGKGRGVFSLWHKWTGKTPFYFVSPDDQTLQLGNIEAWHLLNASVGWLPKKSPLQLTFGFKNITDVRDINRTLGGGGGVHSGGGGEQVVSWGRTAFVRINVQLHSKK